MTLKEMVYKNDPYYVDCEFNGGVYGCPADYPYLNCRDCYNNSFSSCDGECYVCWNREYRPSYIDKENQDIKINFGTWIRCEDKMPKHGQWVLVYTKDGFFTSMQYDSSDPPCFLDDHDEFFATYDVVAWMALPNPPENI